ncbi:MAG: hypothetical protein OHK0039_45290 [Bacteroidia bacterium]
MNASAMITLRSTYVQRVVAGIWALLICLPPLAAQRLQEGYVVSLRGDTTMGFVRPGGRFRDQQEIRFLDRYGVKVRYDASRLQGYGYGDKHYLAMPTPYYFSGLFSDTSLFLLRTVQGPASLYRFYTRRSVFTLQRGPAFFDLLIKPDGTRHEVSLSFRWKRVADAFEDYPELADAIRRDLYKPEELPLIVKLYNDWYRSGAR